MRKARRWAHTVKWDGMQIAAACMAINHDGEYVMHDEYSALEAECERLRDALDFAAKSLSIITSSDGSGHADIAIGVLAMAGYPTEQRERMVDGWKQMAHWRIKAALAEIKP